MTLTMIDFFEELYSDSVLKYITLSFYVVGIIVGITSEFGIIWYERNGNHRYRTVINQLFATLSWIVIAYILLVFIPEGFRYIAGPLDSTFCDIHNFLKNWICSSLVLTFDCIIVLRYIFIFKSTNFAVINDDFIALVLQMSIGFMGFWISSVNRLSVGKMSLNYYLCSGRQPGSDYLEVGQKSRNLTKESWKNISNSWEDLPSKLDTTSMFGFISFILQVVIFTKIFVYRIKIEKETKKLKLGTRKSDENPMEYSENENGSWMDISKSMADLSTMVLSSAFITFYSCILITMHRFLEPDDLNEYKYRWIVYWNQILGISIGIIGVTGSYYVRNRSLRNAIWRIFTNTSICRGRKV